MKEYLNAFILASMGLTSVMADQLESHTQDTNASGGGHIRQSILIALL